MNAIVVLHLIPNFHFSFKQKCVREGEIASISSGESSRNSLVFASSIPVGLCANEEKDNRVIRDEANSNFHEPHIFPSDATELTDGWVTWISSHFTVPLQFSLSITWSVIAGATCCYCIIALQDILLFLRIYCIGNDSTTVSFCSKRTIDKLFEEFTYGILKSNEICSSIELCGFIVLFDADFIQGARNKHTNQLQYGHIAHAIVHT